MSRKTDRRSRQGMESRRRILEATFEIANELGYSGTSIGRVSERAGLPASSVYWQFTDKDELFAEVIQHSFDQWWSEAVPPWDPPSEGQDLHSALDERLRSGIVSIATSPQFWRLGLMLALERQPVEPTARRRFLEIRRVVLDAMTEFWHRVLPADRARPDAPELLARFTMATADGIFVSAQAEGGHDLSALTDLLIDALVDAARRLVGD